jgi:hypothetical protein
MNCLKQMCVDISVTGNIAFVRLNSYCTYVVHCTPFQTLHAETKQTMPVHETCFFSTQTQYCLYDTLYTLYLLLFISSHSFHNAFLATFQKYPSKSWKQLNRLVEHWRLSIQRMNLFSWLMSFLSVREGTWIQQLDCSYGGLSLYPFQFNEN